jgi:nitrogen regulatory protein PII
MKLVTAMISPGKLDALKKALWEQGFRGVTVSQAEGLGFQKSVVEGAEDFVVAMSPRLRVEVAVKDEDVERLLDVAVETLRTGRVGDGKVFVSPLDEVLRVRTGERGNTAL